MKISAVILVFIILLAATLRLWNLGGNPPAAYGDEISFAWNAWSILKTGADEYGQVFPLQFRAFDDYKAPVPVYLLVPFLKVFGLNTFAVRLPIALFALATIYMTYLLGKELLDQKTGLLAALLLAISPWHMHLSRGFFESTLALMFFVSAIYFFVKAQKQRNNLVISGLLFAVTLYTYFTPRILLMLFVPCLAWWGRKWVFSHKKIVSISLIMVTVLILPLLKMSLFDQGLTRINKLTVTRDERIKKLVIDSRNSVTSPGAVKRLLHNRPIYWAQDVVNDYLEHFSLNFWYLYGDNSLRYFLGQMGMFYLLEMPFLVVGLPLLWKKQPAFWLIGIWLMLAPIPAAIAGRPFAVRSLALLPAPFFIVAVGLKSVWEMTNKTYLANLLKAAIVSGFALSLGYYLVRYHLEYPTYAATWWGWENKAAIDLALKEQDRYDQIFISNFYTGAELALAYYTTYDPVAYRQAKTEQVTLADGREFVKMGKFYIGSLDIDEKRMFEGILPSRSLYIARPEEVAGNEMIVAPDDKRVLFYIYRTE